MEPVAPGTEDDIVPISSSIAAATKQEKEKERLLSQCCTLPNGRYGNIFELKYVNGGERWYCNVCSCLVMGWVFYHEIGKRHKQSLGAIKGGGGGPSTSTGSAAHQSSRPDEETLEAGEEGPFLQVAPGEPLPPGYEDDTKQQEPQVAIIQDRLDNFNVGPLVALEYLLELRDCDAGIEPTYLCVLCDKKGDPRTVLTHLASYKHIVQYLQKHFPICYRSLVPFMSKQYKRNWQQALHAVAEAIEKRFGRLRPLPVEHTKFERDQMHYMQMVAQGPHFSEQSGYTFEEFINKEELTKVHEDDNDNTMPSEIKRRENLTRTAMKKRSLSPPIVQNPITKVKSGPIMGLNTNEVGSRRRSRSLSSVSSSDLSDFDGDSTTTNTVATAAASTSKKIELKSSDFHRRSITNRRSPYRKRSLPPPAAVRDYYSSRNTSNVNRERDIVMPWERDDYKRSKPIVTVTATTPEDNNRQKSKIEEYQRLANAIDTDMERVLKQHRINPEKHPQYNDEWKAFWNRRYKELQAEARDPSSYDFKPDWIEYWNVRMTDLHNDELKGRKIALKRRLGLPPDPQPISFKIEAKKKSANGGSTAVQDGGDEGAASRGAVVVHSKPLPMAAQPDHDPEVIIIDEDKDDSSHRRSNSPWEEESSTAAIVKKKSSYHHHREPLTSTTSKRHRDWRSRSRSRDRRHYSRFPRSRSKSRERGTTYRRSSPPPPKLSPPHYRRSRSRERIRLVSELPWERDQWQSYYAPPAVMRDVTRKPVIHLPHHMHTHPSTEDDDTSEVNVVSVLRLLTALEEKLGSLGPKIIDLLAQALAMEKAVANSSEELLVNEVNCVLFETVKEKLKGLVIAGLVEVPQERAFKNAIQKTANLIHFAGELKRKKQKEEEAAKLAKTREKPSVQVAGIGQLDKAAIARQIANALVLQGKTDVSQNELEQLIEAVVGMAESSRQSGKPITTANFLEQITSGKTAAKTASTNEEKPLTSTATSKGSASLESGSGMDGLSDSDLQTLLQNFKDLSTEEQHGLIGYLKTLEAKEPERVERLRKYVNLGQGQPASCTPNGRENSPFSQRSSSGNPTLNAQINEGKLEESTAAIASSSGEHRKKTSKEVEGEKNTFNLSEDDEDYTFDDVYKAAQSNVKQQELEAERRIIEETVKFDSMKEKWNSDLTVMDQTLDQRSKTVEGINLMNSIRKLPAVNVGNLATIVGNVQTLCRSSNSNNNEGGVSGFQQHLDQRFDRMQSGQFGGGHHHQQQQFSSYKQHPNVQYPIPSSTNFYDYSKTFDNQNFDIASRRQASSGYNNEDFAYVGNSGNTNTNNKSGGRQYQQQQQQQQPPPGGPKNFTSTNRNTYNRW